MLKNWSGLNSLKAVLTRAAVFVSVLFAALNASTAQSATVPSLEIDLRTLGWQPAQGFPYHGTGIPENLSVLNDDTKPRLAFVGERSLAIYQSRYHSSGTDSLPGSREMEAFFLETGLGRLINHLTWPTRARRWLNERWDTEARILAVDGGFLVHAANVLISYSKDMKDERHLALEEGPLWSVTVPPEGHSFHVQRIQGSDASGRWLASGTFQELQGINNETPGVSSASDNAVVTQLSHCVQIQFVKQAPRNLCCGGCCRAGIPQFLTDGEIVLAHDDGFSVFAPDGQILWSLRSDCRKRNCLNVDVKTSLQSSRIAISFFGYRSASFDGIRVASGETHILVYDRSKQAQLMNVPVGKTTDFDFALSPDGSTLAVLVGDVVRIYQIHS